LNGVWILAFFGFERLSWQVEAAILVRKMGEGAIS
jgi:hypothetical protein